MRMKHLLISLLLSISFVTSCFAENHCIFALSIIRHGDRTPIHVIAANPLEWQQGLGQLTPLGMHQEFTLGEHLRARLVNQLHLLPPSYLSPTIYIRSSDIDRTLMSATSLLYGLYPLNTGPRIHNYKSALPHRFQPVPIHTVPIAEDRLLQYNKKDFYKRISYLMTKDPVIQQKLQETKAFREKLGKLSHMDLNNSQNIYRIADNLHIRKLHNRTFPKGITTEMFEKLFKLKRWFRYRLLQHRDLGKIIAGNLLNDIASHMQQATNKQSQLKYVLYSAHDITILGFFSAIGDSLYKNPHYASELRFELYQTKDLHFYVDTFYNQKQITLPNCKQHCDLNTFIKIIAPQLANNAK